MRTGPICSYGTGLIHGKCFLLWCQPYVVNSLQLIQGRCIICVIYWDCGEFVAPGYICSRGEGEVTVWASICTHCAFDFILFSLSAHCILLVQAQLFFSLPIIFTLRVLIIVCGSGYSLIGDEKYCVFNCGLCTTGSFCVMTLPLLLFSLSRVFCCTTEIVDL